MNNEISSIAYKEERGWKRRNILGSLRFWGRTCLESLGMSAGLALVLMLLRELGSSVYAENAGDAVMTAIALFPYMLACAGMIVVTMCVIGCFQTYFSLLVSMNVTRPSAIKGIWLSQLGMILGILAMMTLIWKLTPGDISASGLMLIPFFAVVFFVAAAVCIVLGIVSTRWGKIGMILAILCFMLIGGLCGAFVAMSGEESLVEMIQISRGELVGINYWPMLAGSIALYLASGVFALIMTRNSEVRI